MASVSGLPSLRFIEKDNRLVIERAIKNKDGRDYDISFRFQSAADLPKGLPPALPKEIAIMAARILNSLPKDLYTDSYERLGFQITKGAGGDPKTAILAADVGDSILKPWDKKDAQDIDLVPREVKYKDYKYADDSKTVHEELALFCSLFRSQSLIVTVPKSKPPEAVPATPAPAGAVSPPLPLVVPPAVSKRYPLFRFNSSDEVGKKMGIFQTQWEEFKRDHREFEKFELMQLLDPSQLEKEEWRDLFQKYKDALYEKFGDIAAQLRPAKYGVDSKKLLESEFFEQLDGIWSV